MTPDQQRHEELIRATAETLGRSTGDERLAHMAQLYRLVRGRDPEVVAQMEIERMERASK